MHFALFVARFLLRSSLCRVAPCSTEGAFFFGKRPHYLDAVVWSYMVSSLDPNKNEKAPPSNLTRTAPYFTHLIL